LIRVIRNAAASISTRVQAIFRSMFLLNRASALCLMIVLTSGLPAMAEAPQQQELQALERDLNVSTLRQQELLQQATSALAERERLSNQLVATADTVANQERDLSDVATRQAKLKTEIATLNLDLAAKRDVIAEVLAGLQRLEHNPPPALIVAPDDVLSALRGAMLFGTIVPELRHAAQTLHDQLSALKTLREELAQQAKVHATTLNALAESRITMQRLIEEKHALAEASQQELLVEQKRAEELAAKATTLKQLLQTLAEEKARAEAQMSADAKAKAQAEAEALRLMQEKQSQPEMAFSKAQGQLEYPAQGKIIKTFGEESGLGSRLDGIVINTQIQAQVTSPISGKVEFAGQFRSYGNMVIINAGEGYLVLLAGLQETVTRSGQSIKAGEPVGRMGDKPGKMATNMGLSKGLTNLTTPVLYVEFRQNGDPVDSTPWWIGKRQEAMR
jgi:murein hydrolase activator